MNKQTRKALIESLSTAATQAPTADSLVDLANIMAGAHTEGRTDRWKDACALAGDLILDEYEAAGRVYMTKASDSVDAGLIAMTAANK